MMKWRHTLIAGGAIILLTNAVALSGVAYNRSGEPESRLQLTQCELSRSYSYTGKDNSGITLSLNWRFEPAQLNEYGYGTYSGRWGMPAWLDGGKLAQLGFDVNKLAGPEPYGRYRTVLLSREAFLVLELDGPAYQRDLQRVRAGMEDAQKLLAASPDNAELKRKAKVAEDGYKNELERGSRLFAIDAGLEPATLRAAYPDRSRYAIVRGLIQPATTRSKNETRLGGYIAELFAARINVPLQYRPVFEGGSPFEATVAFGRRFEPWLEAAARANVTKEGNQ